MSAVRGKDSMPERTVRSAAHKLGLRFRLHRRDIVGTPDLVFPRHGVVIFVNGCFWHMHKCARGSIPKTRVAFWTKKLRGNVERDKAIRQSLRRVGWRVLTIWECELRNPRRLRERLRHYFRL
jgi:DNA mismatch endonuclease, patch repair protein